ncbi:hypothetical protein M406DRAFT_273076 [Cryphonectria parasitica EP155]|uniref:Amino acid permease/ SLC12A domain-containing protein n=1 Tax=Cryphonectria parasitica (strain ATCC 38755 / EP155) TaxID=660469 RepID=A0A9P5CSZ8_CRYP1|nr:uncharacterized protein M406DRAFT_273076 [Cryphonectria parasitica EP155]KAF3768635.1 hypothetical protein M406DRAFT_273076 [Cryphonectria parasitica EP155]
MIAIAGTIGTGLFLGSGAALANGGPVGFFLGYTIVGCLVGMMMYCLGEMTVFAPNIGGFIEMGNKYISPEMGFAMGINYVLLTGFTVPTEITAIGLMIGFWDETSSHLAAYIAVFLVVCILTNFLGVKYYGEIEFFFACLKIALLVGLIIFGIVANTGGVNGVYTGGKYWRTEPFNDTFGDLSPVSLARFLGFWKVLTQAAFAYGGVESIGIIAGEAHNPRKTMKTATKTVFYRIVGLYVTAVIIIGVNVSQHSPELLSAVAAGGSTAASSPFVVICQQTGVKVLPSVINAIVMTSALSSGNENAYGLSRTMMALARQRSMPSAFLKTSRVGTPYMGVIVAFCFGCLAFLSVSNGSDQAFTWLSNLSALSSLIAWTCICMCYVRFKGALDAQGVDRKNLPLRGYCQPLMAYICIFMFIIILFFNGFQAFLGSFSVADFFASYITIPVFAIAWLGFRLYGARAGRPVGMTPLDQIDLSRGPEGALRGTKYDLGAPAQMGRF